MGNPDRFLDVSCAIIESERGVLGALRATGTRAGEWEFPGGKLEAGETAADCIRREIKEELGVEVRVLRTLSPIEHEYPELRIRLHPFVCRLEPGVEPQLCDNNHLRVDWYERDRLGGVCWSAADRRVAFEYLHDVK